MSEAAWDKAFTQGSTALKNRLMKVHANNPKFQSWLKSSGHGAGASVKQASKEVKPSERVKKLQVKSLQAYGATKGLKVGGEHGSGEMKDTIAPLTRDQHSKIQAAARAAKAAEKPAAAKKTPLTKGQRMAAIAAAVRKTQTKHDVPTMDPDDESHDDLRDLHQSLHIRKGYNEEASPMIKPPTNRFDKKSDAFAHVEKHGGKVYKQTYTNSKGQQTVSYSVKKEEVELEEGKMKDIVTDRQETERLKAQDVLGGPVKSKASAIGGAGQPKNLRNLTTRLATRAMKAGHSVSEGYEYTNIGHPPEHSVDVDPEPAADPLRLATKRKKPVQFKSGMRNGVKTESTEESQMKKGRMLALAVMKKNQLKHPIAQEMGEEVVTEAIKDAADVGEYDYEGDMAKSQLRSILVHAKRLHDMLEDQTNLPEWVQSKITLAQDYILTAADYMEGEMNEEVEQIDEITRGLAIRAQHAAERKRWVASAMDDATPKGDDRFIRQANDLGGQVGRLGSNILKRDRRVNARVAGKNRKGPGWSPEKPKTLGDRVRGLVGPKPPSGLPTMEEVEQVEEKYMGFKAVEKAVAAKGARNPAAVAAYIGRKKYGKEKFQAMAAAGKKAANEETEVVAEAEGTLAVTPKEKELAAHHGDKSRITYGDVLKARLKSAAEKAMKKGN
jgi:hypothetical protein